MSDAILSTRTLRLWTDLEVATIEIVLLEVAALLRRCEAEPCGCDAEIHAFDSILQQIAGDGEPLHCLCCRRRLTRDDPPPPIIVTTNTTLEERPGALREPSPLPERHTTALCEACVAQGVDLCWDRIGANFREASRDARFLETGQA
jgi:hypothetical protein